MTWERYKSRILFLLLALSLIRGVIYTAVILPWQAPDEPRHFEYVKLLQLKGRLVGWGDITPSVEAEIIASMQRYDYWRYGFHDAPPPAPGEPVTQFSQIWSPGLQHELHQPPLAYLLYVVPLVLTTDQETALQLYALRLVSVVLGVIVVAIAIAVAGALFPGDPALAFAIPAFVAFLPMHTFITSAVNNDVLVEVFLSALFLILVVGLKRGFSAWQPVALLLVIVAGLLTKRTALPGVALILVGVPLILIGRPGGWRPNRSQVRLGLIGLVGAGLVAAVGVIAWGQLAAEANRVSSWQKWLVQFYLYLPSQQFPGSLNYDFFSPQAFQLYGHYVSFLFRTFWASFGWENIVLDDRVYYALALVSLAACVGLGLFAASALHHTGRVEQWQGQVLLLFALGVIVAGVLVVGREIRSWEMNLARGMIGWPPARYLFPVIIPIATLFMLGWSELAPRRFRTAWTVALPALLLALDAFCLVFVIIPYFYR